MNATLELLRRANDNNAATAARMGSTLAPTTAPEPTVQQLPALTGNDLRDFIAVVKLVPAGKYALARPDGTIDFLEVVHEGNRDWVRTLIGAPGDWRRIKMSYRLMMFAARHIAADPKAASARFGHHFQTCGKCDSPLSDPASRARGIGPIRSKSF